MSFSTMQLPIEEAKEKAQSYPYALIYEMSDLAFGRTEELPPIHWDECLEARFFSKDGELHFFENEDGMKAVLVTDDGDDVLDRTYRIHQRFQLVGEGVKVREYLDYDKDGQVYVRLTRLAGIV